MNEASLFNPAGAMPGLLVLAIFLMLFVIVWVVATGKLKNLRKIAVKFLTGEIVVDFLDPSNPSPASPPRKSMPPKPSKIGKAAAMLVLKESRVADTGYRLYPNQVFSIGSSPANQLPIRNDPDIEQRHAKLYFKGGRFYIQDLSQKGTWVKNKRIASPTKLGNGDKITVGNVTFIFRQPAGHGLNA